MRCLTILFLLFLAACGGGGARSPTPQPKPQMDIRQCLKTLEKAGVRYRALPDVRHANGCQAVGAVQLLDIGMPITNLKAITCQAAHPLTLWSRDVRQLARQRLGADLVKIESFGTYACRPVNHQSGARLSEHGKANAVDIAAFQLADGRRITVEQGWNGADGRVREFLRHAHRAGCRHFAIVIGPDGDRFHYNHFHLDMGAGPYCK